MPWIAAGASLLGGYLQGESNKSAAQTSANAQLESARLAAEAAKFRPVGVTTRFGSSNFQFNPEGYLSGAGYNVSPEMQAYQNRLMGLAGQGLTQAEQAQQQYQPLTGAAQGLFNLGSQYLQQSPDQVAADYMAKQQALLAPSREQQSANLMNQLQNTGRTGLSVAQGGGLMSANPEAAALANARAMQDLQLAANAQQAGQQQVAFGSGLFNTGAGLLGQYQTGQVGALNPYTAALGGVSNIENLGQQAFGLGTGLGGNAATAGANVGQFLSKGGTNAALTNQGGSYGSGLGGALAGIAGSPYASQIGSKIGEWFGGTPNLPNIYEPTYTFGNNPLM